MCLFQIINGPILNVCGFIEELDQLSDDKLETHKKLLHLNSNFFLQLTLLTLIVSVFLNFAIIPLGWILSILIIMLHISN